MQLTFTACAAVRVSAEEFAFAAALEAGHPGALVADAEGLLLGLCAVSGLGEEFGVVELGLGEG